MCRGNGGQHVFTDDRDREAFLGRLGTVAGAFRAEIHAYALMGTHMHLFVRTREANMARRRVASRARRDKHLKRMMARLS